jgi:hypothetical protein
MRIGITGHQNIGDDKAERWVGSCIRERLLKVPDLIGLASLAKGADQIFASVVLDLGGVIEAVLPFPEYTRSFGNRSDLDRFEYLLSRCAKVTTLPFQGSDESSYLSAGEYVVGHSDLVIAVWNGRPAAGLGGTADIVKYAKQIGKPLFHIDPVRLQCTGA